MCETSLTCSRYEYVPGTEIWLKLALAVASNELREEVL